MEPIVDNVRVFDAVYARLRDAILSRELKGGEPLSVPELARRLGVSRSPVREAVQQLVADGLGAALPRKGAVVASPDGGDLLALHDMRELLEGLAVRRATARIQPKELADLKKLIEEQKQAVSRGDDDGYRETDRQFHQLIAKVSDETRLSNMLRMLRDQMRLAVSVALTDPEHLRKGNGEHLAIVRAMTLGNAEQAEQMMRRHIAASRARVEARLRDQQPPGPRAGTKAPRVARKKA